MALMTSQDIFLYTLTDKPAVVRKYFYISLPLTFIVNHLYVEMKVGNLLIYQRHTENIILLTALRFHSGHYS